MLPILTPLILPARIQGAVVNLSSGKAERAQFHLFGDHFQVNAAQSAKPSGEIAVNHRLAQTNSLKYLRAAVALDGRDAHFGDNFAHALERGLNIMFEPPAHR